MAHLSQPKNTHSLTTQIPQINHQNTTLYRPFLPKPPAKPAIQSHKKYRKKPTRLSYDSPANPPATTSLPNKVQTVSIRLTILFQSYKVVTPYPAQFPSTPESEPIGFSMNFTGL